MKKATEVILIQDASGSMYNIKDDVIGGFNTTIKDQQGIDGECKVTVCMFNDTPHFTNFRVDIKHIEELTQEDYIPSGFTALYDAIGFAVTKVGEALAELPESERPENIIVSINTDGEENRSVRYTLKQIQDMIEHQTSKYNWKFIYTGVGPDCFKAQRDLGFTTKNSIIYTDHASASNSRSGIYGCSGAVGTTMSAMRSTGNIADLSTITQ
jgi:hypothetical protein